MSHAPTTTIIASRALSQKVRRQGRRIRTLYRWNAMKNPACQAEISLRPSASRSSLSAMLRNSFAQYRHGDGALPWACVALDMEDLLPGAEDDLAVADRHRQPRAEQSRLQVGVAVAVMPGLLVAVLAGRRQQAVKFGRQVAKQAWLKFDGPHRCRAAHIEDVDNPDTDFRPPDDVRHCLGQIMHVPVAARRNAE